METMETASVREIWLRAFNEVRSSVDVATVWLAMQAAVPIAIDGHYFVAGLSEDNAYLTANLQNHEATSAIEDALQKITGRVLAFRLIEGTTLADWERKRPTEAAQSAATAFAPNYGDASGHAAPSPPRAETVSRPAPSAPSAGRNASATPPATQAADPSASWEELGVRLTQLYKSSPVKFAHGQARVILQAARLVSDTMDALLPAPGLPLDDAGERALGKALERFGSVVNLDALFLGLEVMRYRQAHGKETF